MNLLAKLLSCKANKSKSPADGYKYVDMMNLLLKLDVINIEDDSKMFSWLISNYRLILGG